MYIFAGRTYQDRQKDLWVYDPKSDSWEEIKYKGNCSIRSGGVGVLWKDSISGYSYWVLHGGMSELRFGNMRQSSVDRYCFDTNTFEPVICEGAPARNCHDAWVSGDEMFICFGDEGEEQLKNDIFKMNLRSFKWSKVECKNVHLAQPVHSASIALMGDYVYTFGGQDDLHVIDNCGQFHPIEFSLISPLPNFVMLQQN